ncbi:MAG: SRPBCC domain-containing protein, partial [Candidatus Eisenbacteria bacterium]
MIQRTVLLPCGREAAFDLFVGDIDAWWPQSRRHSGDVAARVVLDEASGLREQCSDGRAFPLGRVRVWQRPDRLELDFYPGTDPEHPTHVTVTFTAEIDGTRVTLEHRPTDASRDLWDSRAPRYVASWELLFTGLLALAEQA